MERNAFMFDGGRVRFTLPGLVIARIIQLLFWILVLAATLATLILFGFEIAAWMVGFHPIWRL